MNGVSYNYFSRLCKFQGALVYVVSTLTGVATKFVRDWASYYLAGGVVVTSNGGGYAILPLHTSGMILLNL